MVHTLIVDSQDYIYNTLGFLLTQAGFSVQTRSDGAEACRWLQSCPERFIVIMVDNGFPSQTTFHIISTIQQQTNLHRHRFMLLSAATDNTLNPVFALARDCGVIIVTKPFDFAAIVALLRQEAAHMATMPDTHA